MEISWLCCKTNRKKQEVLEQLLPQDYSYKVQFFDLREPFASIVTENYFNAKVLVKVCTKEDMLNVLKGFEELTETNYNMSGGDHKSSARTLAYARRKCQHQVRKRHLKGTDELKKDKVKDKNTKCEASITFSLAKHDHQEDNCQEYPLQITINFTHNHPVLAASAWSFHPVNDDTKAAIIKLFQEGHSASSAYHNYKKSLVEKYKSGFIQISADTSIMPKYQWFFRQFQSYMKENYGGINSPESFFKAVSEIRKHNDEKGYEYAKAVQKDTGDFIIVVSDALSRRVCEYLPQSGDLIFIDATSCLDRSDTKFFRLICPSPLGGLPIGYMLLSSEKEELLCEALELFKTVLPANAFFKRGANTGPRIFLSDDCQSEINSIEKCFPQSSHLLCQWHLKQAIWRWLWAAKHGIHKEHRQELFRLFNSLVMAQSRTEFESALEVLMGNENVQKYPRFIQHLDKNYLNRVNKWASYHRVECQLRTHGNDTNNICESAFRVLKDNTFNRTKVGKYLF